MWIDFDELPSEARVWVYQANRVLSADEVTAVRQALQPALSQWAAHGQPLRASALLTEHRFVVVGVDEGYNLPSGCSIDASVRTLQAIGQQIDADFFDRSVAVRGESGVVVTYPLSAVKAAVADRSLTPTSTVFNTLVKTKAEFLADWQAAAIDTWIRRYFTNVAV